MNAFTTQHVRDKYGVTWQEEYILGMVNALTSMNTTRVLDMCNKQSLMSPATAHKYLKSNVYRKMLVQKRSKEDKRETEFVVSAKGTQFLEEIKHGYVRK